MLCACREGRTSAASAMLRVVYPVERENQRGRNSANTGEEITKMKKWITRLSMLGLLMLALGIGQATRTQAGAIVTDSNIFSPFDSTAVDCNTGETVILSGQVHTMGHTVID